VIGTRADQIRLWDENKHHLIVPRDFIPEEQYNNFDFEFVDLRPTKFEQVDIEDLIELRNEEQDEAFIHLKHNYRGTLNLACGKGKTVLALKLAATLKIPTMIVVNTTYLLEQWREEIERHLNVSGVGIIQGDNVDWEDRPIVIAMLHTLSQRREEWPISFRRRFGLVFYDEGHHMSAPVFVRSADLFFGRRYSLTATAERTDGLEMVYQYHLGRVIHSNLEQDLIPTTVFHRLKWEFPENHTVQIQDSNGDVNLSRVRTYLGRLDWRNELIYEDLLGDLLDGRRVLVLSHSVKHVDRLAEKFDGCTSHQVGIITGATPQEDRTSILRENNPIMGTFQLAREGLNKPELDTLYVVTPFSNRNDLQQAWGRIQRLHDDKKEPLVRIYEDLALESCSRAGRILRGFLKEMEYPAKRRNITVEET
jgi:superfamily II DNA or RNA helicase